ncbi:MAG TPA: endolytic transglycosylase MltG [Chitinophagaceae bacterium]|nr:endolytic transglycosylase MltG [Chitinophagaceae bacterium]
MKKIILYIAVFLVLGVIIGAWLVFGSATTFLEKHKYIFVREGNIKEQVLTQLDTGNIIRFPAVFNLVAAQGKVWEKLKPGRFEVKKGESIFDIVRTLRNNTQSPVRLTINKLRLKEDLARQIGKNFSIDSASAIQFLNNNDSLLQLNVDSNTVFSIVIPDTYLIKWNTSLKNILNRLKNESENFWNKNDRLHKAENQGLTPLQVYILASIVEEETNKNDEKGNIASVYVNRINKGMPLGADPTIKYALRDFSIKRIYYGYLNVESPYNTYRYKGLPPGPVCTPSQVTIDAVLDMPKTDYLFFVAKSDFSGYHHFSNNFAEHEQYAKQYQKALDSLIAKKQNL